MSDQVISGEAEESSSEGSDDDYEVVASKSNEAPKATLSQGTTITEAVPVAQSVTLHEIPTEPTNFEKFKWGIGRLYRLGRKRIKSTFEKPKRDKWELHAIKVTKRYHDRVLQLTRKNLSNAQKQATQSKQFCEQSQTNLHVC